METVTEVPARLKAAVNEPRVRVLCGLRIARFVERCRVRTANAGYRRISDDSGSLWRRQFCTRHRSVLETIQRD